MVVLSDGKPNAGRAGAVDLQAAVAESRARALERLGSLAVSTIGLGQHYDEALLFHLANAGLGCYYRLATAEHVATVLAQCVGAATSVAWRHAQVELRASGAYFSAVLTDTAPELSDDARQCTMRLGDLTLGQHKDLPFELRLTGPAEDAVVDAYVRAQCCSTGQPVLVHVQSEPAQGRTVHVQRLRALTGLALREASELSAAGLGDAALARLQHVQEQLEAHGADTHTDVLRNDVAEAAAALAQQQRPRLLAQAMGHLGQKGAGYCTAAQAETVARVQADLHRRATPGAPGVVRAGALQAGMRLADTHLYVSRVVHSRAGKHGRARVMAEMHDGSCRLFRPEEEVALVPAGSAAVEREILASDLKQGMQLASGRVIRGITRQKTGKHGYLKLTLSLDDGTDTMLRGRETVTIREAGAAPAAPAPTAAAAGVPEFLQVDDDTDEEAHGMGLSPEEAECVVCLDRQRAVACVPCGHLCLCRKCGDAAGLRSCPLCRTPLVQLLRIFTN